MLRKRHRQHGRDKVVETTELGACLAVNAMHCVHCVCNTNVESQLLGASVGVCKLEYDANVSCCRARGELVFR